MTSPATPRIPGSTYRLQFNRLFTFADAARIVPYLHALGVTDCYASSYVKAVPGSLHGYDIVDPTTLNPEIGTPTDYQQFVAALQQHGMGQILDVVPNHMGIGQSSNAWWLDVLENGPSSRYSTFFDIDWGPVKPELEDRVLLPILGDQYGKVLENQEIVLHYQGGEFLVRYYDHKLPIAPKSSVRILSLRLDQLIQHAGAGDPSIQELESIITALSHLPSRGDRTPERIIERYREKKIIKKRLASVVRESPQVRAFLEENVRICNGTKGDPRSFDLLDGLLDDQAYRLAYWRVASEEINYRRFFDINELAAIRMEDPAVFEESHQLIFRLLKEGCITGLRIDHVDGLYDPGGYLKQLQAWAFKELLHDRGSEKKPLYVLVEKILGRGEVLPEDWPVFGTTGYDFLAQLNGLFVDRSSERPFNELYSRFIRSQLSYDELAYEKKKLIMGVSMSSELNVLGHDLDRLSERDRWSRDFTLNNLTHVIREIIACFPVYRTYVTESQERVTERDRAYIQLAVAKAKRRNPALSGVAFDFVRDLLLKQTEDWSPQDRLERVQFVMKFQQTTSPVTAKGIEDTVFYIYNRLASLNEVGGEPSQFGLPLAAFHEWMRERQAHWPHSLSATSTHDTKRSEDVRARINVLSEVPKLWKSHLGNWAKLNKRHKSEMEGQPVPDGNEEYLLYQTLIGAWPLSALDDTQYRTFCDRIQSYMTKALREAKVHTSWVNPEQGYEEAVGAFIEAVLDRSKANPFLDAFTPFQAMIAQYGMTNSLSQVILKVTAPGIPDFYQGTELWSFNLVDPDNRHPVDYASRVELLTALRGAVAEAGTDRRSLLRDLVEARADGRIKMYITAMALEFRRDHAALFSEGDYVPLESRGSQRDRLCAFTRIYRDQAVVAVVPCLVAGLSPDAKGFPVGTEVWSDTHVTVPSWKARSRYRNVLTGEMLATVEIEGSQALPVAQVLGELPVVLLERMS